MAVLGLKCKTRVRRKKQERKNISAKYKDLVRRDYHKHNVIATDVSYIPTSNGFAYLSVAINHKTKMIESWNFSKFNNNELVMKHFRDMNLKGKIVHSDHSYQYSSYDFKKLSREKKFRISMSRVGNSLDNREAEYFFSNIKSESLTPINTSNMIFSKVKTTISNYIDWYNCKRPQSVLNWKTPEQFTQMSL